MKNLTTLILTITFVSCQPEKPYTPPKKEIRGVITEKSDYGELPITGSTVYFLNKKYINGIDEQLMHNYNMVRHCYYRYLHYRNSDKKVAKNFFEISRPYGVYDEKTYEVMQSKAFKQSALITANLETKHTTVNAQGEYSISVDSGEYFVLISIPKSADFYGEWITTRDDKNDLSKSLYNYP